MPDFRQCHWHWFPFGFISIESLTSVVFHGALRGTRIFTHRDEHENSLERKHKRTALFAGYDNKEYARSADAYSLFIYTGCGIQFTVRLFPCPIARSIRISKPSNSTVSCCTRIRRINIPCAFTITDATPLTITIAGKSKHSQSCRDTFLLYNQLSH